jgi:hypothetical protein
VKPVPRWRIAAAIAVMAILLGFGALVAPIYAHNLELQNYVAKITQNASPALSPNGSPSDAILVQQVLDKARELNLPVMADNVHVIRSPEGTKVDVRYFVRVTLPGYTVDLHFHPGVGSR